MGKILPTSYFFCEDQIDIILKYCAKSQEHVEHSRNSSYYPTTTIIKVIQNLMSGLEEENNIKSIKANCLHPGTTFSNLEEIMNTNK